MLLDVVRWGPNKTLGMVKSVHSAAAMGDAYANDIELAVAEHAREHGY